MEFMSELPDNYYPLSIVDPPYELPKDSSNGRGKLKNRTFNKMDILQWDTKPSPEYFTELFRVSKNQIIWGGNYFPLPPSRCMICWDKLQPWENFSQIELAWTSFNSPARIYKFDNRTGCKIHPTEKPIALYEWLLANYAKPGDKIFDSHGGSMSSAIACHNLGFDLDICELDPEYFQKAKLRFENHVAQTRITFAEPTPIEQQSKLFEQ
jgi:site-specific DNA-methyltransferase (adenine-specific)